MGEFAAPAPDLKGIPYPPAADDRASVEANEGVRK
jgi:hypothetical protein